MDSRAPVRIINADARTVLSTMPSASVDAIVTDPPWNLAKDYGAHDDALPADGYVEWLGDILLECARVARGAVVYLPGAVNRATVDAVLGHAGLRLADEMTWLNPHAEPLIWAARTGCAAMRGCHRRAPERAIHAPEPPANDPAFARHPCPKPPALMRFLVESATPTGGTVLDPFAGTGTTLVAARQARRSAVGIEIEGRYCAVARRRVQKLLGPSRAWGDPRR